MKIITASNHLERGGVKEDREKQSNSINAGCTFFVSPLKLTINYKPLMQLKF